MSIQPSIPPDSSVAQTIDATKPRPTPLEGGNMPFTFTIRKTRDGILFQAYTLWLFTFSDIKTVILPTSTFGIVGALSVPPLLSGSLPLSLILSRTPYVIFWIWSTLLPFAINNQHGECAVLEDSLNKPWRPFPSRRISAKGGRILMMALYCANIWVSKNMEVHYQSLSMLFLGIWYNRFGGADRSCVEKNLINAAGYLSFTTGALKVVTNTRLSGISFGPMAVPWFLFIGLVIFTTIHAQDFEDMEGDAARGRRTVPLVIGDNAARWIVTLAVPFWSLLIPWWFQSQVSGFGGPVFLSGVVAYRFIVRRTRDDDRISFRIWNSWMVSLYIIPFYVLN